MTNCYYSLVCNYSGRVKLLAITLFVKKGVFTPNPEKNYSTAFLLEQIPDLTGKTVIDMCCGSGISSIYAAQQNAKYVLSLDNSRIAILNTKGNAIDHGIANEEVRARNTSMHFSNSQC